jgi:hypothetical protein
MTQSTKHQLLLFLIILSILLTGCGASENQTDILFIGNSYTATNGLPDMFERVARAGGHRVHTEMVAPGGWTLENHTNSRNTIEKIRSEEWDYVVLQEQSVIPSLPGVREEQMYPAVRQLNKEIMANGAETILYMTWGRRDGLPNEGHPNFTSMQAALEQGYLEIGNELNLRIAPVGTAWWNVLRSNPRLNLWVNDGSHPTKEGTYLAACVFYAVIFDESPEKIDYTAGIDDDRAETYQTMAAATVQPYMDLWNLPSGQ